MHHSGYYLVPLIFGTTIPTSFNILVKCFLHFCFSKLISSMIKVMYPFSGKPQIVGEISGLDHGVYGVAHHEGKVAVVAGTTLYSLNIIPKMYTSTKELP